MSEERQALPKPVNYDQLFPGRFLKAGLFLGKTPTFTIASIDLEKLPQDDGREKARGIIAFRETELQVALNSTNGQCLKAMFGPQVQSWVGKHVTLCTDKDRDPGGKGMVDCVRVYGSPDIAHDMTIDINLPRRKPKQRTLRRVEPKQKQGHGQPSSPAPQDTSDPAEEYPR